VGFEAISAPDSALSGSVPDVEVLDAVVGAARDRVAALPGVEPHAEYGSPQEVLAQFSVSVDLLVVGSRGYGRFGRLIHGSTSQSLARSAACPLLAMPRAVRAAAETGASRGGDGASVDVDA